MLAPLLFLTGSYLILSTRVLINLESALAHQVNGKTRKGGDGSRRQDDKRKCRRHIPFIKPFANFSVVFTRVDIVRLFSMGHGDSIFLTFIEVLLCDVFCF